VILFALAVFGVVFALSRTVSIASMSATVVLPAAVAVLGLPRQFLLLAIVMTALVIVRFRENIQRIARGEEPKFQPKRAEDLP
jgi:acyl phosphate:glycerol-3-phosphate acyltransferase